MEGLRRHGLAPDTGVEIAHDTLLLRASRDHDDRDALLSLRWGASHHLNLLEMASRVLDEDGRLLAWQPATDGPERHEPFRLPVLRQWWPELASLER